MVGKDKMEKPYENVREKQESPFQKPIGVSKFNSNARNKAYWEHQQILAEMDARLKLRQSYAEAFM